MKKQYYIEEKHNIMCFSRMLLYRERFCFALNAEIYLFLKKLKKEKLISRMIYVEFMRSRVLRLTRKHTNDISHACTANSIELGANEINHTYTRTHMYEPLCRILRRKLLTHLNDIEAGAPHA